MFRFRVRKNPDPLLKFTQKAVLFQDISIFFVLKTELYLSSGTYFFFWKLVFHFKPADQLPIFFQKPLIFPGLYDILVKDLILKGITKEWAKPTLSV